MMYWMLKEFTLWKKHATGEGNRCLCEGNGLFHLEPIGGQQSVEDEGCDHKATYLRRGVFEHIRLEGHGQLRFSWCSRHAESMLHTWMRAGRAMGHGGTHEKKKKKNTTTSFLSQPPFPLCRWPAYASCPSCLFVSGDMEAGVAPDREACAPRRYYVPQDCSAHSCSHSIIVRWVPREGHQQMERRQALCARSQVSYPTVIPFCSNHLLDSA